MLELPSCRDGDATTTAHYGPFDSVPMFRWRLRRSPSVSPNTSEPSTPASSSAPSEDSMVVRRAIDEAISRLRLDLRRNFLKETKRFARKNPDTLDALLRAAHPTDPLFLETPDVSEGIRPQHRPAASFLLDDRARWSSIGTFVVASATASIGPGKTEEVPALRRAFNRF